MPQMSPYNWLILFLLFILNMIIIMVMNYNIFTPIPPSKNLSKIFSFYNWKW